MSALTRSTVALAECKAHVSGQALQGTPIESFLAQHVLVIMCAEMQFEIHAQLAEKLSSVGSSEFSSFISGASKKLLRSIKTSEISGFLGLFSTQAKDIFSGRLDDRIVLQYNAAVQDRHMVAHSVGSQLTIGDMEEILEHASAVLLAIDEAFSSVF